MFSFTVEAKPKLLFRDQLQSRMAFSQKETWTEGLDGSLRDEDLFEKSSRNMTVVGVVTFWLDLIEKLLFQMSSWYPLYSMTLGLVAKKKKKITKEARKWSVNRLKVRGVSREQRR